MFAIAQGNKLLPFVRQGLVGRQGKIIADGFNGNYRCLCAARLLRSFGNKGLPVRLGGCRGRALCQGNWAGLCGDLLGKGEGGRTEISITVGNITIGNMVNQAPIICHTGRYGFAIADQ